MRTARPARLAVPLDAPAGLLSRRSVRLFNGLHHRRGRRRRGPRPVHYGSFFFPLDGIAAWNRLYGRRGFVQYQCVLPKAESPRGLAALLARAVTGSQTALVIGAASDIGRAVARRLARGGCALQLAARHAGDLAAEVQDMRPRTSGAVTAHHCDVLDADGGASLLDGLDPLPDIAVCVVGLTGDQTAAQESAP